ncbi:DUF6199 family natural product biosynthesis protein [Alkaliphilus metalliredigens]|uniref:DUF6199 family natural product biosynthesis protein n=1 Tax=Alkaliphilus metalliredigens TaxID=208226 RepID=UPI0002F7B374|nr:DUF6199 family natural product biosynthesis protein [Alkaliphilus metalliredigens]
MPIFFKLSITVFLLVGILKPQIAWQLSEEWKIKGQEPSEGYLLITRFMSIGVLAVIWIILPS